MDTRDRFGACVICHKDLIIEKVADGKIVKMFSPEHDQTRFNLKDVEVMTKEIHLSQIFICLTIYYQLSPRMATRLKQVEI